MHAVRGILSTEFPAQIYRTKACEMRAVVLQAVTCHSFTVTSAVQCLEIKNSSSSKSHLLSAAAALRFFFSTLPS